ncbi:hypothetical protein [Natronogracilivirga saccharolytica]|nr:hypothetical protein [Natronogracilivirga saccharolytica]
MLLLTGALACTSTSQTPMSLRAEKDREAADEDTLESVTPEEIADVKTLEVFNRMHDENRHYLQLEHDTFMKTNRSLTKHVKAQKALFKGDTELAYEYISQGLNRDETADMLALKGSVYHSMGDNEKAEYYWNKAVERNTDVVSDLYPGLKYWYSQR